MNARIKLGNIAPSGSPLQLPITTIIPKLCKTLEVQVFGYFSTPLLLQWTPHQPLSFPFLQFLQAASCSSIICKTPIILQVFRVSFLEVVFSYMLIKILLFHFIFITVLFPLEVTRICHNTCLVDIISLLYIPPTNDSTCLLPPGYYQMTSTQSRDKGWGDLITGQTFGL